MRSVPLLAPEGQTVLGGHRGPSRTSSRSQGAGPTGINVDSGPAAGWGGFSPTSPGCCAKSLTIAGKLPHL